MVDIRCLLLARFRFELDPSIHIHVIIQDDIRLLVIVASSIVHLSSVSSPNNTALTLE